jgi:hypothetical protein
MKRFKFIMSLFTMLLLSVFSGGAFAMVLGVSPFLTSGAVFSIGVIGSLFPGMSGVLSMAVTVTTAYAGEVLEELLVRATTGNEIVDGGHIRVQPNISKKFSIPRLKAGRMLQKRKAQPVTADSKGDFTITEKYLEPQDVMAYTEFNPRVFEAIWKPFQPTGALVFEQLPAAVQSQLLAELAKVVDFELGGEFINGVKGNNEGQYFDGILTRITADGEVISVPTPAALVQSNIIAKMKLIRTMIRKPLKKNPNLKYFMSVEDSEAYEYELTDKPTKGQDYTNMNPERFKGIQIVALADWPKDVIVAAVTSTNVDSNFWAGVGFADDTQAILIDKVSNAGENYFFKMLLKADTNIVFGEDIVLYDGRDAAIAAGSTDLNDLELNIGDLVPAFSAETKEYTMNVATGVNSFTVTATGAVAGQIIKLGSTVLNTGVASAAKNLAIGENIINVSVKSADGNATATYQVLVTRAEA